jgi:Arc/MetJ family transcription regulator
MLAGAKVMSGGIRGFGIHAAKAAVRQALKRKVGAAIRRRPAYSDANQFELTTIIQKRPALTS